MRVAAVGDVHLGEDLRGRLRPQPAGLSDAADVLLLAGDLTQHGTVAEAQVVAEGSPGWAPRSRRSWGTTTLCMSICQMTGAAGRVTARPAPVCRSRRRP